MIARQLILLLLLLSIAVNLFDRQVLSVLAPVIREDLGLTNTDYSYILFSFLLGMTLFQVPAGMLLDRWGVRLVLPLMMVFWSAANALHAGANTVAQFCAFRFLLGVGECGNYSAGIKTISRLFPPDQRALAGGIFNSGTLLGSFLAPPLVVAVTVRFGWPVAFLLPSGLGLLWILPWLLLSRAEQPAERRSAGPLNVSSLLRSRHVWGVILMRIMGGPVIHFYWYWLPEYLKHERGFSIEKLGMLAGVPFFFAGLGNIAGGWLSGRLMKGGWSADRSRKTTLLLAACFCLSSMLVPVVPGEWGPISLVSMATFGATAYSAVYIGTITDLFSERVLASLSGLTGMGEGLVNMTLMLSTGIIVDRFSYLPVFLAAGLMPMLGFIVLMTIIRRVGPVA